MPEEEILPPCKVSSPCASHLPVGTGQHGRDSRDKNPAPLQSAANFLTVTETGFYSMFSPKNKVCSKNSDCSNSNNTGVLQKGLKPNNTIGKKMNVNL